SRQYAELDRALAADTLPDPARVPDLTVLVDGDRVRVACGAIPDGHVAPDEELLSAWRGRPVTPEDEAVPEGDALAAAEEPEAEAEPEQEQEGKGRLRRLIERLRGAERAASPRLALVPEAELLVD